MLLSRPWADGEWSGFEWQLPKKIRRTEWGEVFTSPAIATRTHIHSGVQKNIALIGGFEGGREGTK